MAKGYADLNFTDLELVDFIAYKKGPFYPEVGDFSGAGAADIHLVSSLPNGIANAQAGVFGYSRILVADSPAVGTGNLLYAIEYNHYDGPWDLHEESNRLDTVLRYHWGTGDDKLNVTANVYVAPGWHSTDQVPERAIDDGQISRFGAIDTSDGGNTGRASLAFDWTRDNADATTRFSIYGFYNRLNLYSNFTYFLDDPIHGDQFEQIDERWVSGAKLERTWHQKWFGGRLDVDNTVGVQLRNDYIPVSGLNHTEDRQVLNVEVDDKIEEFSGGAYVNNQIEWLPWLRTQVGLRADVIAVDVNSAEAGNSGKNHRRSSIPRPAWCSDPGPRPRSTSTSARVFTRMTRVARRSP